jgi:outer membrane autotransporter protein
VGLVCAPAQLVSPDAQQTYLWGDANHLSTAGQTIEADYIYSLLAAPSQISMLAETAVQSGLSRAGTIQRQINLSGQHRGPNGVNAWVSAGASSLSMKNAPDFPNAAGRPFGGTVGADYMTPGGIIVGMAVSAGGQTRVFHEWPLQSDGERSASMQPTVRPLWGDAIASYGLLQNHIARQVTLGRFMDRNDGNADGHSLALALRGGYDLHLGPVSTGPVAGAVLQQVRIGGFTETGSSGYTALSFGSQTRGSAVTQPGWRVSVDAGNWQPFADVQWNHEWADKNRTITASLTSIAAPSWSSPAVPIAANWASGSVGVSYRVNPQVIVGAAAAPSSSIHGRQVSAANSALTSASEFGPLHDAARIRRIRATVTDEVDGQHGEEDRAPANSAQCGALSRTSLASNRMRPQVGMSGGKPRPRNDSVDSVMMAAATSMVPQRSPASAFGRMWRTTTRNRGPESACRFDKLLLAQCEELRRTTWPLSSSETRRWRRRSG